MRLKDYTGLTADSRQVKPGYVFVAEKGVTVDGHDFIDRAIAAGAKAVVCEHLPAFADQHPEIEWVTVPNSAIALGELADEWYDHPSQKLTLVGVTGTNGKTTIATLLYDMARLMGQKAGLFSTVANKIDGEEHLATHTTPDVITLHQTMAKMVDAGCTFCAMEVSSHAAHQHRIAGLKFDGAIFTNLTRDHLDYHKTFANYLAAKKSFFDGLEPQAFALTNLDDKNGEVMLQNTKASRHTYSICKPAEFRAKLIENRLDGMLLELDSEEVHTRFTGRYNASNLTAVYGACRLLGWNKQQVLKAISMLHPVAGRMQTFHLPNGVTAIVDYAHTPDALTNTLSAIAETLPKEYNGYQPGIITVTGAGGDRDHGKRPLMAAEAAKRSRMIVLTSDNPRSEDPAQIIADMKVGIPANYPGEVAEIVDRAKAIAYALDQARPGEAVLVAGKGHETYQIIGNETHHFDDCEQIKCWSSSSSSSSSSPKTEDPKTEDPKTPKTEDPED